MFGARPKPTTKDAVLVLLRERGAPLGPSEIAESVGATEGYVRQVLGDLLSLGLVVKPRHGRYGAAPFDAPPVPARTSAAAYLAEHGADYPEDDAPTGPAPAPELPYLVYGGQRFPVPFYAIEEDEDGTAIIGHASFQVQLGRPRRIVRSFTSAV